MIFKLFMLALIKQSLAQLTLDLDQISVEILEKENYFNQNRHVILVALNSNPLDKVKVAALNELKRTVDEANNNEGLSIKIHAIKDEKFIRKYSILRFPQVVFFRDNRHVMYKGEVKSSVLLEWLEMFKEKKSVDLSDANFEHDTQASTGATTGDWFVLFHKTDCKVSSLIEPTWEQASMRPENRVIFAYVNIDQNPHLMQRFDINNSPTLLLFRQGLMYRYEIGKYDVDSLISFSSKWYKNVKGVKVPIEKSSFDRLVDGIFLH
ncbi:thioredoxin domain-containing [Brachionus plicatilis]|uniref:Thioredoxin domain-containing n=1 Tax=Brachionus plicatilis TaxID=10195 RepID=A0A3M7SB45_BRAPC|nr:thioredoxin domain-containing [Brachionus plicatilis]